ncbi:MAG: hypothetical protein SGILL_002041 [Bacillariaceae sp.]
MRAAVATGFGDVDGNIFLRDNVPVPTLSSTTRGNRQPTEMLIRVLAVSLAPGDPRVLSGATDWIQLPKGGHPYIIGSDVAGVVVQIYQKEKKFKVGDYVVSRFELPGPVGGAAEYRTVKTALSEKCPRSISPIVASGLPASSAAAKKITRRWVKAKDRVLVIGGSGAVGSSVIQYARVLGASYVAAVSTHKSLCTSLGADRVIDYRHEKWWELEDFQSEDTKFDVVFDMVNGDNWALGGRSGLALHPKKSKYVLLGPGVQTKIELHSAWDLVALSFKWTFESLLLNANRSHPHYVYENALDLQQNDLAGIFEDVVQGKLHPVVDPGSPFPFTQEGVRDAMKLQESCHAEGKVVIEVSTHEK